MLQGQKQVPGQPQVWFFCPVQCRNEGVSYSRRLLGGKLHNPNPAQGRWVQFLHFSSPCLCPILTSSVRPNLSPQCSIPIGHYWIQDFGICLCETDPELSFLCHPLLVLGTWLCCFPRASGGSFSQCAIVAPPKHSQEVCITVHTCGCQPTEPLHTPATTGFPALVRTCNTSYTLANTEAAKEL